MIDHAWIAAAIPHQGTMCLLNSVIEWNDERIICCATSHREPFHPLAIDGVLGIAAGIEYAAQAIAVHGALLAGGEKSAPKAGYLTSIRDVKWQIERLDDLSCDLIVQAERIAGNDVTLLYRVSISAMDEIILTGRASVLIDVAALRPQHSNTSDKPL